MMERAAPQGHEYLLLLGQLFHSQTFQVVELLQFIHLPVSIVTSLAGLSPVYLYFSTAKTS